jgi:hypothetical protein
MLVQEVVLPHPMEAQGGDSDFLETLYPALCRRASLRFLVLHLRALEPWLELF